MPSVVTVPLAAEPTAVTVNGSLSASVGANWPPMIRSVVGWPETAPKGIALATGGVFTTVYTFTNGTDGQLPAAGLIQDCLGYLYGTTTVPSDESK